MSRRPEHAIYPEAIPRDAPPSAWRVEDDPYGSVDLVAGRVRAPLSGFACPCGQDHAAGIRWHEQGHVAFTPANWHALARTQGIPIPLIEAVEDARVGARLDGAGIARPPAYCPDLLARQMPQMLMAGDLSQIALALCGAWHHPESRRVAEDWLSHVDAGSEPARFALYARGLLRSELTHDPEDPDFTGEITFAMSLSVARHMLQAQESFSLEMRQRQPGDGRKPGEAGRWMPMTIQEPALTHPARRGVQRRWTSRDEGVLPSAIHRLAVDGRIFKQSAHRPERLALLVDCSGSMLWDEADLRRLLDQSPASTVALYASQPNQHGYLRVVARNGRRVADGAMALDRFPMGGANGCDGPALRWLGSQRGRRVWLSDGHVNGLDGNHAALIADTDHWVRAGRVMRVPDVETALAVAMGRVSHRPGWAVSDDDDD